MSAQSGESEYLPMVRGSDEASSRVEWKLRLSSVFGATWKLGVGGVGNGWWGSNNCDSLAIRGV